MKLNENTSVAMPVKNMIGIIIGVAMGIFAYTEITARLTSLETSRELMNADLLKKSEQTTTDSEQFMLLEELYKTVDKLQETQEQNMTNKVNIEFTQKQLEKALADIEKLKTKKDGNTTRTRQNRNEILELSFPRKTIDNFPKN